MMNGSAPTTPAVAEYFDELAATWEKHYGLRGSMQSRLERFGQELQQRLNPPGTVLDFGCGTGDLSFDLAMRGYQVRGVDRSSCMIERSRSRFDLPGLRFTELPGDGCRLPFASGEFGACVSSSVLEYLKPLDDYLAELRRVVRQDGILLATVPNRLHPLRMVEGAEALLWRTLPPTAGLWPRGRLAYLRVSENRFSSGAWRRKLMAQRWQVEWVRGYWQPLLLICARAL